MTSLATFTVLFVAETADAPAPVPGLVPLCPREALLRLAAEPADAVLIALSPAEIGELAARIARQAPETLIIAHLEVASLSTSMALMRHGVHEVLSAPLTEAGLARSISDLARRHGQREGRRAAPAATPVLVGTSMQMEAVAGQMARLAAGDDPVFISGEAGTGKSLAALVLCQLDQRRSGPLESLDCAADRVELALFGVGAGLSSDAPQGEAGALERADCGVLVLEGIEKLDHGLQARLMRVLRTGVFQRVGESRERPLKARICCVSALSPLELVAGRHLRDDLFYRLQALPLYLPPLRQRIGDIEPLAHHFIGAGRPAPLTRDARQMLADWHWPQNVRELRAILVGAARYAGAEPVGVAHLRQAGFRRPSRDDQRSDPQVRPMWQQEQDIIEKALAVFGGNVTLAAEALEVSPSTIYRKRQAWAGAA
jgi:two-component system repressor protein LuxO